MKNYYSKAIVCAGVMASAMALSSMCVFAASYDGSDLSYPTNALAVDTTYNLKAGNALDKNSAGTTVTKDNFVYNCKVDSNGANFKDNKNKSTDPVTYEQQGALLFKVPAKSTVTFTSTDDVAYYVNGSTTAETWAKNGSVDFDVDSSIRVLGVSQGNSTVKVSAIKVETKSTEPSLTVSPETLTIEQGSTGTITANLRNATGITWTSSDKTGKVTVIGDDTGATVTVADDAAAGDVNITATAGSLTKTVTVTVKAAVAFTKANASTGKVDFTKDMTNPDPTASDGKAKYTEGAVIKDYFKASGSSLVYRNAPCVQTGSKGSGNLYFELSDAANVTVTYNTTGNKNVSDIAIKDSETGKNVSGIMLGFGSESYSKVIGGVNGKTTFTAYNLPAGSYEIYSPCETKVVKDGDVEIVNGAEGIAISRGARVYDVTFSAATTKTVAETKAAFESDYYCVDKDVTYLIHPITGDVSAYTSITGPDGTASNEVYKAVKFTDGSSITASDLGCDYIYAVAITDAGRAPVKALTWTLE